MKEQYRVAGVIMPNEKSIGFGTPYYQSDCTIITGRMVYEGKGKSRIGRLKKNQYILRFQIEQGKLDMSIR